jgi:hypothetical protein
LEHIFGISKIIGSTTISTAEAAISIDFHIMNVKSKTRQFYNDPADTLYEGNRKG